MPLDIAALRAEFPALAVHDEGKRRIYFDNPAGTQVPRRVIERMSDCLIRSNANLGGYFASSVAAGEVVQTAHEAMRDFLNAPSAEEIVFGQNSTTLVFHIARSLGRKLKPGDEIIVTHMDHEANVGPWLMLAEDRGLTVHHWPVNSETFELDLAVLDGLVNERTRLIAVNYASNATGTVTDVKAVAERAHAVGALVFVDAVQFAPHRAIDVQAIDCDFLVCSAYKFYGPHQGILWGRREILQALTAYKLRTVGEDLPHKYETGTQSHEGMAGTLGAIEHLAWVGREMGDMQPGDPASARRQQLCAAFRVLAAHEDELAARLLRGLEQFDGIRILGIHDAARAHRRVPTVSFVSRDVAPSTIARSLAAHGIFVWSGHNYALELYRQLGMEQEGGLRVGFAQYNTMQEVDRLLELLPDILVRR